MRGRDLALAVLALSLLAAAALAEDSGPGEDGEIAVAEDGEIAVAEDGEVARLEQQRERSPNDAETRAELGWAYYRRARRALEKRAFAEYESDLGKAMDELVESARLDPESPAPHNSIAVVAAYQGNLDGALRSFANARQLEPRAWTAYTNIAQVMTYRGAPRSDIERWVGRAERLRAEPEEVDLILCLASWRDGNLEGAERHFKRVRRLGPRLLERWDGAPLAQPLDSLADLMAYCCSNPACGPYLADACQESKLEATRREIPEEVARRELLIEMERRRKLNEIYEKRKDLKIEVEKPEEVEAPEPAPPPRTSDARPAS